MGPVVTASINIPLDWEDSNIVLSLLQKLHMADQLRKHDRASMAARGPRPKLPPVECAPWCDTGDGHPDCFGKSDQACWAESEYVGLSLAPDDGEGPPRVGVMARREPDSDGAVRVHLDGIQIRGLIPSPWDVLDENLDLTPDEAEHLAAVLVAHAKLVRETHPRPS